MSFLLVPLVWSIASCWLLPIEAPPPRRDRSSPPLVNRQREPHLELRREEILLQLSFVFPATTRNGRPG